MQIHQTDFSTGNVYRNIMEVAVPMIIAQILNLLYNIVDRIYIGRIPEIGATCTDRSGTVFSYYHPDHRHLPIFWKWRSTALLHGTGKRKPGRSRNAHGKHLCDADRHRSDPDSHWLIFYRPILYAFGASDVTFSYAADYIRIYLLGTLFVMITLGMNPFINSQGFGNTGMLTILIGAVLNILLDPLFIFGMHMGVRGAALATIISQFCSAIWVLRFLTGKKGDPEPEKKRHEDLLEKSGQYRKPGYVRFLWHLQTVLCRWYAMPHSRPGVVISTLVS